MFLFVNHTNRLSDVCFLSPHGRSDIDNYPDPRERPIIRHMDPSEPSPLEEQVLFREMSSSATIKRGIGRAKSARRGARDWLPILYGGG